MAKMTEGSPAEIRKDKAQAKKAKMPFAKYEKSASDTKDDAKGMKRGGSVKAVGVSVRGEGVEKKATGGSVRGTGCATRGKGYAGEF